MNKFISLPLAMLFFVFGLPFSAFAETTIHNDIRSEVRTGGNTASPGSNGRIETGNASARVEVFTEVNGETVEDFDERIETDGGTVVIEREHEVTGTDPFVETRIHVEVSGDAPFTPSATGSPKNVYHASGTPERKEKTNGGRLEIERKYERVKNQGALEREREGIIKIKTTRRNAREYVGEFISKIFKHVVSLFTF